MRKGPKAIANTQTTLDRLMKSTEFREHFEREKQNLDVSEMLVGMMESEGISVRELAKRAKVSASIIQDIRSGKRENPTIAVLSRLVHSLGGEIIVRKGRRTVAAV